MPAPDLDADAGASYSHVVKGWWARSVSGTGVVVPDGEVDLMWSTCGKAWIAGPDTEPKLVSANAGEKVIGVRLRPGAVRAAFGQSTQDLTDCRVPLDQVVDGASGRRTTEQLAEAQSAVRVAEILMGVVAERSPDQWRPDPVVELTLESLRNQAGIPDHGMSERQHRRRFTEAVGYGPKFYARICRFDRFCQLSGRQIGATIAELAVLSGYFDQAHLGRDCLQLSGRTPAALVSNQPH